LCANYPVRLFDKGPDQIFPRDFVNYQRHPLGIECSTECLHTALLVIPLKVFGRVLFGLPILASKFSRDEISRIKIGLIFLRHFLYQDKKWNGQFEEKRSLENICENLCQLWAHN
jgi:hypothetical protein